MQDARINFDDSDQRERFIEHIKGMRGEWVFYMEKPDMVKPLKSHSYYFGFLLPFIAIQTGHTSAELHDIFVTSFVPTVSFRNFFDLTTYDMTQKEMSNYIDRVRLFFEKFSEKYVPRAEDVMRPGIQPWPDVDSSEFKKRWKL